MAIKPDPAAIFIPSRTLTIARGMRIFKKICQLFAPAFLAALMMSSSTELSPAIVEDMTGYIEFQMITNTRGVSPIPIKTINNGKRATDGTFFVELTIGMIRRFNVVDMEHATATENPTTKDMAIPVRTILSV